MDIILTCRTEGCKSYGRPTVLTDSSEVVVCGWCGNEITDRAPVIVEPVIDTPPAV